jgi:cell division protein ZapA (FtsZ GTPase activity inhibitor)
MDNERIQELRERIADLKRRWPAHSVPASMLQELDDLEEELAEALIEEAQSGKDNS